MTKHLQGNEEERKQETKQIGHWKSGSANTPHYAKGSCQCTCCGKEAHFEILSPVKMFGSQKQLYYLVVIIVLQVFLLDL
ncbi:hypothetical protein GDO86_005488 [Hymenochirus boettgeri]|uniref:Uncharacterized protein n=1 Tax=Hymenochirus boettgeri TaxID=247094 RepID=A0A8T2J6L4_9PIPI|nr:hypothetical protein GDO86_005488 [Hymenochirus boettgeri]